MFLRGPFGVFVNAWLPSSKREHSPFLDNGPETSSPLGRERRFADDRFDLSRQPAGGSEWLASDPSESVPAVVIVEREPELFDVLRLSFQRARETDRSQSDC